MWMRMAMPLIMKHAAKADDNENRDDDEVEEGKRC